LWPNAMLHAAAAMTTLLMAVMAAAIFCMKTPR
jgi:hypothetical protein